jgi:hypothetical protein
MADRYPERPFPADDNYDRGSRSRAPSKADGDPLAELARLIGASDFAMGRANLQVQPRTKPRDQYDQQHSDQQHSDQQHSDQQHSDPYELPAEAEEGPPPGPPSWMKRVARQEQATPLPQHEYPSAVHPVHRYAAANPAPEADYEDEAYADADQERDPSRYDDALYGELDSDAQDAQHGESYTEDAYAFEDEYSEETEPPKRRRGMITFVAVFALAFFGVGGAYAYRTYVGSARSGEPPIIRADNSPTKIIPAPTDGGAKLPDRMLSADTEKIVPREEAPVDVNARSGARVIFPPPNQTGAQPSTANAAAPPMAVANAANGTLPNGEPRKIKTFTVRGDQGDAAANPAPATIPAPGSAKPAANAKPATAAAPPRSPASVANANANAPLSLSPQTSAPASEPATRVAATSPTQAVPGAGGASGGYLVQVASQRSEADAQASYKALQTKYPSVLGSHSPLIKRADLGEKGVYYRAMVGPFGSSDEASQFCGNLKSAGGQCVIQRN